MASYTAIISCTSGRPATTFSAPTSTRTFRGSIRPSRGWRRRRTPSWRLKADKTALTSLAATVDGKAEIVTGSYTGSGGTKTVSLGFRPKLVVVPLSAYYTAAAAAGGSPSQIFVTSNGFSAQDGGVTSPNESGRTYYYAALR